MEAHRLPLLTPCIAGSSLLWRICSFPNHAIDSDTSHHHARHVLIQAEHAYSGVGLWKRILPGPPLAELVKHWSELNRVCFRKTPRPVHPF